MPIRNFIPVSYPKRPPRTPSVPSASMGYRGKLAEREEARLLRAQSWTLADIAAWLHVSKSSVSVWVRDVEFVPSPRRMGAQRRANRLHDAKVAEIERLAAEGFARIGQL